MKIRRQRKHRSRAQRREHKLREARVGRVIDEEGCRQGALNPNTAAEELFILAAYYPNEVRRNPALPLAKLALPRDWEARFQENQYACIPPLSPGQKTPRALENFNANYRWRRHAQRSLKRQAYYQAQLAAGRSLSSIVQSIKTKPPTP